MNKNIMPENEIEILHNAFATPIGFSRKSDTEYPRPGGALIGGIYNSLGEPHTKSLLRRRSDRQIQFPDSNHLPSAKKPRARVKKGIYGGILINHFGHFLLEGLSRAWAINAYPDVDVYFHLGPREKHTAFTDLKSWQQQLLSAVLTNPKRLHFISENTCFDELIVPEPGFVIQNYFTRTHAEALAEIGQRLKAGTELKLIEKKIWLSRSLLTKGGVAGEKELETALEQEGFLIIHPELLPLGEQIRLFEGKNIIAGFTGSAFHTLLFAQSEGGELLHFSRTKSLNSNFGLCADQKNVQSSYYNFFRKEHGNPSQDFEKIWRVLYERGLVKAETYHCGDLDDLQNTAIKHAPIPKNRAQLINKKIASENSGGPALAATSRLARRINRLAEALNAKSYLELAGSNTPQVFNELDIAQRTVVNPKFPLDMANVTDNRVILKETTSDAFFSALAVTLKYDVVQIDGLPAFEQAYRDFCNSLLHSHDRTVFLLNNTKPGDEHAAMINQKSALQSRRQAGGKGRQWQSDVFKAVFALHDFHPGLNYRTIADSGVPQTLIWRSNSDWRKPLFNSLEAISRLTYADLLEHLDILKICSEQEAVSLCLSQLAGI